MSKAVTKGMHWMPRMASYSLHGQRNGRVDILPANAKMPTFRELEERYECTRVEYNEALADYNEAKRGLKLIRLLDEACKRINALDKGEE